ncbi:BolA/IbaG family iron-sulfur metabolism protein [SAR86 cluster bacterium]|jgi:acid stress-induced BolA-like protein IbaG/YrbA|nr:BolA/IbaG family iron-sulfur metabolism protein [SAR86 cluster bacterium]
MNEEKIRSSILNVLPDAFISFHEKDCNFKIKIISKQFTGLNIMQRHKLILGALEKFIKSGELHAVSLETLLPAEHN